MGAKNIESQTPRSAASGRNQTSAIVRSSVANSVTLLAREDGDGPPAGTALAQAPGRGNADARG